VALCFEKTETGVVEFLSDEHSIREMSERNPARFSATPPPGHKPRGAGYTPPGFGAGAVGLPVVKSTDGRGRVVVFDLLDPSGPAEVLLHGIDARDALARSPRQYVAVLPLGVRAGPKCGRNRIVLA
jgi:hypothetical protein